MLAVDERAALLTERALDLRDVRHLATQEYRLHGRVARLEPCCLGEDLLRLRWTDHDDAVLEFPQSGERFEGVDNFREWREQYPAQVEFRLRRITGSGDVWVGEVSIS